MKIPAVFLALGVLLSTSACETDDVDEVSQGTEGMSNSGGVADGPSSSAVESCRGACDRLQFFECIDADTHEVCWQACPSRIDDDLELFSSCVMNSLPSCDSGCLNNLLDAPEPEPDPTGSSGSDGTNTCEEACQAYINAGCDVSDFGEAPTCALACSQLTDDEQAIVAACFNSPETCEINPACVGGGEEGGFDESGGDSPTCQLACDDLLFYDCIAPAEHSTCYSTCGSAPTSEVDVFIGCVSSVGSACDGRCYDVFVG